MEKTYPLIIVFYLDREMMKRQEIIQPFVSSVNEMLHQKNANALAFFLPTDGEEFVDCINPMTMKEADMVKVNEMVEDIKKNFSVGVDIGVKDTDIVPDKKECTCADTDGICNCNN
jgi:phosphoenolpyruvate carboxylase